ncbi:unnamed protein product [Schistosoma margrebowiei]|uniref:Uncharacterized protein n=1 Tax=Schistosoma margrebowiei TaxID=48269 RepID=A0A183MI45_9TREM|nr:unnamed protein product [Schistosoma margrebowiei]
MDIMTVTMKNMIDHVKNIHCLNSLRLSVDIVLIIKASAAASAAVGFNIHKGKSEILQYNTTCTNPITIDEDLEDVKTFTYLSSIIDEHGGSDADVKTRIGKARAVYLQLKDIWNLKQPSVKQHQGQNFQYKYQDSSTVWEETWTTTKATIQRIRVFINSCPRKILRIR